MSAPTLTRRATVAELTTGTQVRDLVAGTQVRAAGEGASREVAGIAVPWDDPIEYYGIREEFAPGSVTVDEANPPQLFWRHQEVIGGLTSWEDAEDGWDIAAAISDTTLGRDAHTLAKDGHVRKFSIGFVPLEWEELHDRETDTITLRYTKVLAREVSLVPHPAYGNANLTHVRQDTPHKEIRHMSATTVAPEDLDEVRAELETVTRRLELVAAETGDRAPAPGIGAEFRSYGEYVKALAAGDEVAARAFTGAVSGDTIAQDGWVGNLIRLGTERQKISSLFQHTKDLPPEGMNIEHGVLLEDTVKVEQQTAEGEPLAYGKVKIGTRSAPVITLGGWSDMSRQAIERARVTVLDYTFQALYLRYMRAVELLTRSTLTTAYNDATATALASVEADWSTQDGIVTGLIDLVEHMEDNNANLSGLLVAKDAFLGLLSVPAEDRVLQVSAAPEGKLGTVRVSSIEGNIAGVDVTLWPGAPTGARLAYDEVAVRTQEAPGAPFRLQDENIVNLTKAFSVYGYGTSYVQHREGLVKVSAPVAG